MNASDRLWATLARIPGPARRRIIRYLPEHIYAAKGPLPRRIHYGCGPRLLSGWLNVDLEAKIFEDRTIFYQRADLSQRHPWHDGSFRFGFGEDFLEHLSQAESIIFLSEAYRTFGPAGVLRLSFPGLKNSVEYHLRHGDPFRCKRELYEMHGHHHLYCEEGLEAVATCVGWSKVEFLHYGKSQYPELCGLDYRIEQITVNIYAELTK